METTGGRMNRKGRGVKHMAHTPWWVKIINTSFQPKIFNWTVRWIQLHLYASNIYTFLSLSWSMISAIWDQSPVWVFFLLTDNHLHSQQARLGLCLTVLCDYVLQKLIQLAWAWVTRIQAYICWVDRVLVMYQMLGCTLGSLKVMSPDQGKGPTRT